jgi:hypothetical protein
MSPKCDLQVDFRYDFELFGLVSKTKEYKLAWSLNKALDLNLAKSSDLVISFLEDRSIIISNFVFQTNHGSFRLLSNKGCTDHTSHDSLYLLPELTDIDYLLMVQLDIDTFDYFDFSKQLMASDNIQAVASIRVHSLQHKENLIF